MVAAHVCALLLPRNSMSFSPVGALRRAALVSVCAASVVFAGPNPPSQQQPARDAQGNRIPKVQIAILLDNSGSMEGLLNQARTEIWKVVNEFATAKQRGVRPRLEIGRASCRERVAVAEGA